MHTWALLLRGINVGGQNPVAMPELREALVSWGYVDPVTYIQSGNVVVGSRKPKTPRTAAALERRLSGAFGYPARLVVRDRREMGAIVRAIPKEWDPDDATVRRYVLFLTDAVSSREIIRSVKPKPDIESVEAGPHAVYWSAPFATLTRTAMVKIPAHPSYGEMTARNHRTTLKLYELMRDR